MIDISIDLAMPAPPHELTPGSLCASPPLCAPFRSGLPVAAFVAVALLALPAPAAASPDERVPRSENFSTLETSAAIGAAVGGIFLLKLGHKVLDAPAPSMGLPAPDSLDARLARRLYQADGEDRRFLWGLPATAGVTVIPALPFVVYGASTLSLAYRGRPLWPAGDWNVEHRLWAYVEALGWTYMLTGVVKYAVGRPRPYTEGANNHPELRDKPYEDQLSFFSGHSSGAFAAGAFVAEDLSRYLQRDVLVDDGPWVRFLVGTLMPYALGYGIPAVVGLSRIVDQHHWPSDVLMGALVGSVISHLVYATHFDAQGRPRRRHRRAPVDGHFVPVVSRGADGVGQVSLAFGLRY
jgi:membrane-associated phospholipid phosphatase